MTSFKPAEWTNKYTKDFLDKLVTALKPEFSRNRDLKILTLEWWLSAVCEAMKAKWAGIIQYSDKAKSCDILARMAGWPDNFLPGNLLSKLEDEKAKEPYVLASTKEKQLYLPESPEICNLTIISIEYMIDPQFKYFLVIGNQQKPKGPESEQPLTVTPPIALLAQFSGLMMEIQNRRLDAWQNSLHGGSRESVRKRAWDLLREHRGDLNENMLDKVQASEIDASVLLEIVPHLRTTTRKLPKMEAKDRLSKDSGLSLSRMAFLRQEVWQAFLGVAPYKTIIDDWRTLLQEQQDHFFIKNETGGIPDMVEFSGAVLDKEITQRLWPFSHQNLKRIEFLRTHLFLLYYLACSLEGVADKQDIVLCDEVFQAKIRDHNFPELLANLLEEFLDEWGKGEELVITSEWLILWFGKRLLKSQVMWNNLLIRYTPNRRAQFYRHFASYFLYTLFLVRYFGEPGLFRFSDIPEGYEDFVDAALFLVAEYAHQMEGLPASISLYRIISHIWSNEAILYTVHKGYRDHHHHVWNVCLLGLALIESGIMERLNSTSDKLLNWILSGLLHDIGYSANLNRYVLSHLQCLPTFPALTKFLETLQTCLNNAEQTLCKELNKFGERCSLVTQTEFMNHGLVSAAYLLFLDQTHRKITESAKPTEEWYEKIKEALEAIGKHDLTDADISPIRSPLAFLLLLCDHLQEWDRPRLESERLRRCVSASLHRPGQVTPAGSTLVRHLRTNLLWREGRVHLPEGKPLNLILFYKDAARERFEPALIWCQNTYEFQSLALEEWPQNFEIHFTVVHPLSNMMKTGVSLLEMDLFEDFASDDEYCRGLIPWFKSARDGSQGIAYKADIGVQETFSWIFKQDSKRIRVIEDFPSDLYNRYSIWKEQRLRETKLRKRKDL